VRHDHVERWRAKTFLVAGAEMPLSFGYPAIADCRLRCFAVNETALRGDECRAGIPGVHVRERREHVPARGDIQARANIIRQRLGDIGQIFRFRHQKQPRQLGKDRPQLVRCRRPSPALETGKAVPLPWHQEVVSVNRIHRRIVLNRIERRGERLHAPRQGKAVVLDHENAVVESAHDVQRIEHHLLDAEMPPRRAHLGNSVLVRHRNDLCDELALEFLPSRDAVDPHVSLCERVLFAQTPEHIVYQTRSREAQDQNAKLGHHLLRKAANDFTNSDVHHS